MLDNYQDLIDELLGAPRLIRSAITAHGSEAPPEVLGLIAENRLNSGRADQAARLYRLAGRMSEDAATQHSRVLLRLGRLDEARVLLKAELRSNEAIPPSDRSTQAHREANVLLALICALHGEGEAALRYAQQGLEIAHQRGSALLEAVAHIRAGHALHRRRRKVVRR